MTDDKILQSLKENDGAYISGEEICKLAGMSRAAIWKRIEKLREEGYEIEALPHLGYRLTGVPDRLIPQEIRWGLSAKVLGRDIMSYAKVDSTNDVAYALADKKMKEGTLVIAEEQTKGKGRHGRSWSSPANSGIYMSCILRPDMAPGEIPKITLMAAVAVARALREATGLNALIKWPNDILINGKKVCGILTEMKAEQDRVDFVVLGIGVNVNTPAKALPKGASSLLNEMHKTDRDTRISRVELTRNILEELEKCYDILKSRGSSSVIEDWKSLSGTLGARVKIVLPNRTFEGQAHTIDRDGALIVRLDSGAMERVSSGDIIITR